MPTYDFFCNVCAKRFEVFLTFSEYGTKAVHCEHCGSENVRRRMNKVRIARSMESRVEGLEGEIAGMDGLENDPRAIGRMMKKMGSEMGEELPAEFDEVVDRLEAGQSPEDIESAMPGLGESLDAD